MFLHHDTYDIILTTLNLSKIIDTDKLNMCVNQDGIIFKKYTTLLKHNQSFILMG